jgi:hypothetical protein
MTIQNRPMIWLRVRNVFTFRRIFPLAFSLMVFASAVHQSSYIDPDLWWHLQTGQDIVLSKTIPHVDIYSFSKAGSEWVTHEWLSEVFIYAVYRSAGWGGLLFIFSGLITIALYITYRRCDDQPPYVAALAGLLAAAASSPLFGIRPQMITFLFASIYIALLSRYERNGQSRPLWWMVPIMLLWVNFHAGYALGLALIALYFISIALDRKWHLLLPPAMLFVACTAVVPVNPNGFRMFSYPLETLTSPAMFAFIQEWASPNFHELTFLPLALLLFLVLGALALTPKRVRMGELFLLLVTSFGALRSIRHIPIFALIAAPIFARHLWYLMESHGWEKSFTPREVPARLAGLAFSLVLLFALAALGIVRVKDFVSNQPSYEAKNYPQAAVDFLEAQQLPGPIYNRYIWGGYLIRKLYPKYPVYIDGRADVYGDAFIIETMRTDSGYAGWQEPLERLAIRTVLVSPEEPLSSLLRQDEKWNRVYEDRQAVIFTRSESDPNAKISYDTTPDSTSRPPVMVTPR